MSGKMRIIIAATLGLAAFGGALMFSWSRQSHDADVADREAAERTEPEPTDLLSDVARQAAGQIQPTEAELDQLVIELREKRRELNRRRRELDERERHLAIAEGLLAKQAEELEDLRLQLIAPLTTLRETTRELRDSRELIARQEQANLRGIAAKYERLDERAGAEILVSMVENGQEADAVRILYYLSERSAAKMLGAIPDRQLAARLVERMKRVEEEG